MKKYTNLYGEMLGYVFRGIMGEDTVIGNHRQHLLNMDENKFCTYTLKPDALSMV